LLLRTVATCVPSMAHITFGASVMIFRSWSSAGRGRARCGASADLRDAVALDDPRTGERHDFTRKRGVAACAG